MANPPESVEALIRGVTQVHSLPLFYSRLDETINHPRSSIANIAKLISEDPGLTGRILKLANSPLFACLAKIESITQAITIIGVQQVRDLALAISVMDVFKGIPAGLIDMQQFWRHSIATGIADGLGLGHNARAALITRGLAEMARLGVALGGKMETFMGLTGMGDLILTATGDLSRNRTVGLKLASAQKLDDVLGSLGHVAEGVYTARETLALAQKHGVDMPITRAVCAVLFEGAKPRDAVASLLAREAKGE